jgi:hypothetical protein
MRKIYTFTLNTVQKIEETEITKDDKGNDIKTIKLVNKKVKKNYFFARPSRSRQDETELFRAQKESEFLRKNILSIGQVYKKNFDENSLLTKDQTEKYDKLRSEFVKLQTDYYKIIEKEEEKRTEDEKKNIEEITKKMSDLIAEMQPFEDINSSFNNLYNNTAEILARNQSTRYLTLFAAYEDIDGKHIPLFGDGTYEDRLKKYDEIEEGEDKFMYSLIIRFMFIANFYYMNKAEKQEDYDLLIRLQEMNGIIPKVDIEEDKEKDKEDSKDTIKNP